MTSRFLSLPLLTLLTTTTLGGVAACSGAHDGASGDPSTNPNGDPNANNSLKLPYNCPTKSSRSGVVAGSKLDFAESFTDTTWFNSSLEEVILSPVDELAMTEAGLSRSDKEDVRRFKYFAHGFDFRWIAEETPPTSSNASPTSSSWFTAIKADFSVYLFDLVDTTTPVDETVSVFDASPIRQARLSGDKKRLADTIRRVVDAMRADKHPKAVVAFAPDRSGESTGEQLFINLFAKNVHFATTGSVKLSNLRDHAGASFRPSYPMRDVTSLDLSLNVEMEGAKATASAECLPLTISGP